MNTENNVNLLQGNVTTPTVTKLSELRKLFEVKTVEDNHRAKKTTTTTRKNTPARKTPMELEEQEPHLQWGQEDQRRNTTSFKVKFKFENVDRVGRQPDAFVTPQTVVPLDCYDDTTAVQPTSTTKDPNIPCKAPSRQKCLLPFSPLLEPLPVVAFEICASKTEVLPLMTSQICSLIYSPVCAI